MKRTNESGRSMVEMLGVLAIIGVLSIGGIAGYTMAMNRYRANEVLDIAAKYAVTVYSGFMTQTTMGHSLAYTIPALSATGLTGTASTVQGCSMVATLVNASGTDVTPTASMAASDVQAVNGVKIAFTCDNSDIAKAAASSVGTTATAGEGSSTFSYIFRQS